MTEHLTVDDLLEIASITLGSFQLRDPGLLASAAARPQATVWGQDAYESLADKAAALVHSLVRNHAFIDGNKRMGWVSMRAFLQMNDHDVRIAEDVAYDLVIDIAKGELDVPQIAALLTEHLVIAP